MMVYCGLFHLLNIHIYTVSILLGSHNIVNNIERVQWDFERLQNF